MKTREEIERKVNGIASVMNEAKFDGEEVQLLLEKLGMDHQILKQLISSTPTSDVYDIIKDKSEEALNRSDRAYISAAVSHHLYAMVTMVVDIVNELTEDVHDNYRKSQAHGVSFDWFFMTKAEKMFTAERVAKVAGGDNFLRVAKSVLTTHHE
jgi:hypothetical protein